MKLAACGLVPGRLQKGCPLGDDELKEGLSGAVEQSRGSQPCAPGPPRAKGGAASASPGAY